MASELFRRHPSLTLIETHPGGGQYDCLSLVAKNAVAPKTIIDLNRAGRIHVHEPHDPAFEPIEWATTLPVRAGDPKRPDAHAVVKRLEDAAGLQSVEHAPPSTPAALVYRVIARVLGGLVNDKYDWDARNEFGDSSMESGERGYVRAFPAAAEAVRKRRNSDLLGIPSYRFWALLRAEEAVAMSDVDGTVYLPTETRNLATLYHASGRRLYATIG